MDSLVSWNSDPSFYEPPKGKNLPHPDKRNILITSALPYVNNVPHLGNIIGCVLSGDVFSRYCKIRGYQSIHISGTDEYGTATEMKALQEGVTPKEICDKFYVLHKNIYEWFNIEFDNFGRTSTEHQTEIAQDIFKRLQANNYTCIGTCDQLHCSTCNKFLADRYVSGICPNCQYEDARGDQCDKCGKLIDAVDLIEPKCHVCKTTPVIKSSEHIFLELDKLSHQVEEFLNKRTSTADSHWSSNAVAIAKSWIKTGLEKRCITRDLKWGTPVPLEGFEEKVFYVWYDAPIGYLSITKGILGEDWKKWWKNPENVELYNFIGKDNVAFHAVIFPACLLGTKDNYTMVKNICATEYLNYEDQKFSKSRGTGIFGDAIADIGIPADIWRFYLIYMRPENQDTAFSWDDFSAKVNSELLSNLGNFIHRSLMFLFNSFDATIQEIEITDVEKELLAAINEDIKEYTDFLEDVHLREALTKILAISRKGNQYMQLIKPWELVKSGEDGKKKAGSAVSMLANISVLLGTLLYPFMPQISKQIRESCNIYQIIQLPSQMIQFLKPGLKINQPVALFSKLEADKVAEWKRKFGSASTNQPEAKPAKKSVGKKEKDQKKNMTVEKKGKPVPDLPDAVKDLMTKVKTNLENFPNLVASNPTDARKILKELELNYTILKQLIEGYTQTWGKHEVAKLTKENKTLGKEVEALVRKLTDLEVAAGIKQVPLPQNEVKATEATKQATLSQSTVSEEPVTKPVKEKTEKKKGNKVGGKAPVVATDETIDVGRLDLRVGRILEAKKHPDADALYVETIDLGEEKPRTVVSGLVKHVPLEEMQNRLVVCLCNLKPAKMRGIESQAMVMCASSPEKVEIMEVDPSSKPGDIVTCEPFIHRPDAQLNPKKKIWEDVAPDLMVSEDGKAVYKGNVLLIGGKTPMTAPTLKNVNVK